MSFNQGYFDFIEKTEIIENLHTSILVDQQNS